MMRLYKVLLQIFKALPNSECLAAHQADIGCPVAIVAEVGEVILTYPDNSVLRLGKVQLDHFLTLACCDAALYRRSSA